MHPQRPHFRAAAKTALIVPLLALCVALNGCGDGAKDDHRPDNEDSAQETLWQAYIDDGSKAYAAARYAEAEKLFKLAVSEAEHFGRKDPRLATSLNNLAALYVAQGKYAQAEPLYKRSLAIIEKALGPEHPSVATSLESYGALLKATGRAEQGEAMLKRAAAIRKKLAKP